MTELGLPVPEGFVVPADVLATVVDAEALRARAPRPRQGAGDRRRRRGAGSDRRSVRRARRRPAGGGALERLRRGLRHRLLRRPAGDLPVRPRRRRGARPRARLLGVVLLRARDLLPREEGLARRPRHGGRRAADGRARRSPACCSPATRCAAARPHGRRGGARARRGRGLGPGHARPLHPQARRHDPQSADLTQPFAIVPVEDGGTEERELGDEGGEQKLAEDAPAPSSRSSATTSSSGSAARRTSSGRSRAASCTCCRRGR